MPNGAVGMGAVPAASALMELASTTRGFLPPRMTEAQRDAIATPATGLVVYNTNTNALNYTTAIRGKPSEPGQAVPLIRPRIASANFRRQEELPRLPQAAITISRVRT